MAGTERPRRGGRRLASVIAAVVVTAAVTLTASPSITPAHAAARVPLAVAAHASGRGHGGSRMSWMGTWLSVLGRPDAVAGGVRVPPAAGLSALHPPGLAVQVGANPNGVLADTSTHTVYVADGNSNSVSVINAATCNAADASGCGQTPATVSVGSDPVALALNHKTHTLYVTNLGGNTVSVVNAATCNATDTTGCGQTPATVTVGSGPALLSVDQATDTIYVPNSKASTISAIDGATCNATDTSGCGQPPATITVGSGPNQVAIDKATGTLYSANFNDNTVSVVDATTCNAQNTSGCGHITATVPVGSAPAALLVDTAVGTLYVANNFGNNVSMLRMATCNAAITSGCGQTPATASAGSIPSWLSLNPLTSTVYVANQEDSDASVIDAATCNATTTSGCRQRPQTMVGGFDAGGLATDASTDTVYLASQNNDTVSVLNGAACNGMATSGCTRYAPVAAVGVGPQPVAVNQATHTIYVANFNDDSVSVISASACNPDHVSGCAGTWPTIAVGPGPQFGIAVDQPTDTVYVANFGINTANNTVSVINGATCNSHVSSGCGQAPATITVGNCPAGLAINHATGTLYVADACDNTVSVVNMAICNAKNTSGCGQTAATVATGNGPIPVGVNEATDTVYVGNNSDSTVSVISGATCNAHTSSGCGQSAPTVAVADSPYGLAVDQHTDTVYVANTGNEFFNTLQTSVNSSVSVINGAACNGQITSGCGQAPFAVPVGGFDWDVAVDPGTGQLYVTSIVDSDVAVMNTATCNGHDASGCQPHLLHPRTGGWPADVALDPADGAMYITDNVDATVSVFPLS